MAQYTEREGLFIIKERFDKVVVQKLILVVSSPIIINPYSEELKLKCKLKLKPP